MPANLKQLPVPRENVLMYRMISKKIKNITYCINGMENGFLLLERSVYPFFLSLPEDQDSDNVYQSLLIDCSLYF